MDLEDDPEGGRLSGILTEAERAALWPAAEGEISDLELEALGRGWRRREAARQTVVFALGVLAGVATTVLIFAGWLFLAT